MAMMNIETLLEAARFLDEVDKQSSSQSEFSSSASSPSTTSSTASSPSTASPISSLQHQHAHHLHSHPQRGAVGVVLASNGNRIPGAAASPASNSSGPAASWSVKMSAASPTAVPQTPLSSTNTGERQSQRDHPSQSGATVVVATNQGQYPTAKAVSLSVANLPQQTAAIPLIIGQQPQQQVAGSAVGLNGTSTKYGQSQTSTTLLGSINQATILGPSNGIHQITSGGGLNNNNQHANSGPTITAAGGITRIVDSAGNILHLPSGTAAAAVNSAAGGGGGPQYSTLMRVKGHSTAMDNMSEEQFANDSLPPSLVVISPQNYALNPTTAAGQCLGGGGGQQHQNPPQLAASAHPQTISIIPGPAALSRPGSAGGGGEATTGLDLSHVDFVHSTSSSSSGSALLSNQKPTNTFELTTTNHLTKKTHHGAPVAAVPSVSSVFVHRKSTYPVVDLPASSASSTASSTTSSTMLMGSGSGGGGGTALPSKVRTISGSSSGSAASIMKGTNFVGGGKHLPAVLLNGNNSNLMGSSTNALAAASLTHFQHSSDRPEDLSSHLTFNLSSGNAANIYQPASGDAVNTIISKTSGGVTTATLHVAQPRPIINLSELSLDPQQLQDLQQQQSLYQMVYQKGVAAGTATSAGRRRTTSNNSTGGSQRSPSSMRSGTRESHNKLEKNRRAQMRACFLDLKEALPKDQEEKKTSNLSILSNALKYIMTLKRTDKEWEHEQGRLVKEKIGLEIKLGSLKREMAAQLDQDPALASLVATGPAQRSIRTSESGAEEVNSMDGYPSNGDETDSFRGSSTVERSMSPRNMSPLVISGGHLNGIINRSLVGDPVTMELKPAAVLSGDHPAAHHLTVSSGAGSGAATIVAMPNFNQVSLSSAPQLPLTAINLSTSANLSGQNSSLATSTAAVSSIASNNSLKNGLINIPSTQIISSGSPFLHAGNNGPHVIVHQPQSGTVVTHPMTSTATLMKGGLGNNGFSGVGKNNGLVIRETVGGGVIGIEGSHSAAKGMKFGNNYNGGENLHLVDQPPPAKMLKLVNGQAALTSEHSSQGTIQHTQVLPIYTSTQNGGLRVIGHHTTTTTTAAASNGGNSLPPNVVFSDATSSAGKYHQHHHLPSGMVISGAAAHPYLANGLNGGNGGGIMSSGSQSGGGAHVHKLLLTGLGPNMVAQNVSTTAFSLPSTTVMMQESGGMFPTSGSTSLPGGAQLNVLSRSPSSTPSPTISVTGGSNANKGIMTGKGGRMGTQINSLPLVNGMSMGVTSTGSNGPLKATTVAPTPPSIGGPSKVLEQQQHNWGASQHSYVPFQMINPQMQAAVVSLAPATTVGKLVATTTTAKGNKGGNGKRQANGGANTSRAAKRKSAAATAAAATTSVMITPQTSMEPVMVKGKGLGGGGMEVSSALNSNSNYLNGTISAVSSMASITLTNSKPTIK